ncbi:MAG: DUF2905 domain-containing protein [Actinomycetota bacterium]|nr:DUF2905 domain-containing protein [Actinomycetota bacterium]
MNLEQLGKILIFVAAVVAVAGVLLFVIGKGLGLTRIPGDILYRRDGLTIFFPIMTSIIISIVLTIVLNLIIWFIRR